MRFGKKSVLYRYLVTYIGIAIIACAIVGTFLLNTASRELFEKNQKAERERLAMACSDLASNFSVMENIVLRVQTSILYQPFFLANGQISHMEMLEAFQRFRTYAPLIENYYLYYPESDTLYTPTAEYQFYIFVKNILMSQDIAGTRERIMDSDGVFSMENLPDNIFLCYKIQFVAQTGRSSARMIFELNKSLLQERCSRLFNIEGPVQIIYRDHILLGDDPGPRSLECTSVQEQPQVTVRAQSSAGENDSFRSGALTAIIIITVIISVLSVIVAWRSYLPIRRITSKIYTGHGTDQNEVKLIEDVLDSLLNEKQDTMNRLTESLDRVSTLKTFLRRQITLQLLLGNREEGWEDKVSHSGMMIFRPFLQVLCIQYSKEDDADNILLCVEAAATEDVAVYAARLTDVGVIAVILAANDSDELEPCINSVKNHLFDEGFDTIVAYGNVVNNLNEIPLSLHSAQTEDGMALSQDRTDYYHTSDLDELKQALWDGASDKAEDALDRILEELTRECPSILINRYMVVQLIYQIVSIGKDLNILLPDSMIRNAVLAENDTDLQKRMREMLEHIILERNPSESSVRPEKHQKIIDFINEHAYDYNMCLDLVASEFDISTKQVTRVVRNCYNDTFKGYLLKLRMEKARNLLCQGIAPSEVTQRIGYSDERYFKKRFQEYTGESAMRFYLEKQHNNNTDEEA